MKNHEECKRGFTHLSKSWYGKANLDRSHEVDSVTVGFYHPKGGTTGEFTFTWEELGGKVTPKLTAYDDSWNALFLFGDMLEEMAAIDGEDITPDDFCNMLVSVGIENMTQVDR